MAQAEDGNRELRSQFVRGFPRLMAVLREVRSDLDDRGRLKRIATIQRIASQIMASAASLDLGELRKLAGAVESASGPDLLRLVDRIISSLDRTYAAETGLRTVSVLLVSGDPCVLGVVRPLAARLGQELTVAGSVEEARSLRTSERWNLFVLDAEAPGGDCLEFVGDLCRDGSHQDTPIVILTPSGDGVARSECWAYGVEHVEDKPVEPVRFELITLLALERHRAVVERAYIDELTGVNNRRGFRVLFMQSLAQCRRYGSPLSLAILDLDCFSVFNNTYGHKLGDRVLAAFAQGLQVELRESDIIGRWGGEEFLAAFPSTLIDGGSVALQKVAQRMRNHRVDPQCSDPVTFSGGIVEIQDHESLDDAVARADGLLYAAKRLGRDRVLRALPRSIEGRPRILIAEDDPLTAATLKRDLGDRYDVTHVGDGRAALSSAGSDRFDLVLLDQQMPGLTGLEVLRLLRGRQHYRDCPIMILTGLGADSLLEEAFSLGADDYVTKPYSRRALLARIERHIGR